jgi:hypothetical protein
MSSHFVEFDKKIYFGKLRSKLSKAQAALTVAKIITDGLVLLRKPQFFQI